MVFTRRWLLLAVVLIAAIGINPVLAQLRTVVSDDFNGFRLNRDVWTIINPQQTARVRLTGANTRDAWLEINVPGGLNQDIWFTGLDAPRVMQQVRNTDFEVETRFESDVVLQGQSQGILFEQDNGNYLYVFFTPKGGQTSIVAAGSTNYDLNLNSPYLDVPIAPSGVGPLWLRVKRVENEWTIAYSLTGEDFNEVGRFSHRVAMIRMGLYAGVFNFVSDAPAFRMVADYFMNLDAPIADEDGGTVEDAYAPVVLESEWLPFTDRVVLTWETDEAATAVVEYGLTTDFESGSVVVTDLTSVQRVEIDGLEPDTRYNLRITLSDALGNEGVGESFAVTTLADEPSRPEIDLWYGSVQQFGNQGIPQRWINILGSVADPDVGDRVTMTYSLNGGSDVPLKVGADRWRLAGNGDFNIELPVEGVLEGENILSISAVDRYGNRTTTSASVFFTNFNVWGLPYAVDWTQTRNIQTAVQVVDGRWELTPDGLRVAEPGYRRMIAIGDVSWTDYELYAEFTINGLLPPTGNPGQLPDPEPYLAAITRWTGYFAWDQSQPALGPLPVGAVGRFIWRSAVNPSGTVDEVELLDGFLGLSAADDSPLRLTANQTYRLRMRTFTTVDGASFHAMRIWRVDADEPSWWNVAGTVTRDGNAAGSIALVANRVDLTWGPIQVSRLTPDAYLVQTYDNTAPECIVTVAAVGANLRADAGPNFQLVRSVAGGAQLLINGQKTGADGETWYRASEDGSWMRANLVTLNPDCDVSAIFVLDV